MRKSIGKRVVGRRQPVSVWNVFIPSDLTREDYIRNCYRTYSLSLVNDNSEAVHNVPIGKMAIQMIVFPENHDSLGSTVLCGYLAFKDTIAVLDVFDFEGYEGYEEHQFKITKNTPDSSSEVVVDGGNGITSINAHSKKGKAIVNISSSDKDKTAEVNVNSNGTVNINSNKGVSIKDNIGIDIEIFDGVEDQNKANISANRQKLEFSVSDEAVGSSVGMDKEKVDIVGRKKVNIGDGKEPIVLGKTLSDLLKDLIKEIAVSQTNSGPLLNSAKIAAYIEQVDTILSEYGFTQ